MASSKPEFVDLRDLSRKSSVSLHSHDEGAQCQPNILAEQTEPLEHGTLGKWTVVRVFVLLGDIILALVPLMFLVLAIVSVDVDHKLVSAQGHIIERILLLAPTIFPIVFTTIMSKFFKAIGLYKAERGIKLGTLERFMGCQSLFGALERQVALRHLDIIGVTIVVLWLLSPVGGQSALRLLSRVPKIEEYTKTVRYLPSEAAEATALNYYPGVFGEWFSFTSLFLASFLLRTQHSLPMDIKGNVKIPTVSSLISPDEGWNVDIWRSLNHTRKTYSAFLGIPVHGITEEGNSSFYISSRHWTVNCGSNDYVTWTPEMFNQTLWDGRFLLDLSLPQNLQSGAISSPFRFVSFANIPGAGYNLAYAQCEIGPQDVEAAIKCQGKSCQVDSMRLLNHIHPATYGNYYNESIQGKDYGDFSGEAEDVWNPTPFTVPFKGLRLLFALLPKVTSMTPLWGRQDPLELLNIARPATPLELWIQYPGFDLSDFAAYQTYPNISQVPLDELADRLEAIINTLWLASYGARYISGNIDDPLLFDNGTFYSEQNSYDLYFNSTQANVTQYVGDVFICHTTWAAFLGCTSTILFIAALLTIVLKFKILAPDIFGFVSTSTRDNPHAFTAIKGSHHDGLERARVLRNLEVVVGDVAPNEEVGHIALATTELGRPQRLRRGRYYN